MDKNTDQAFLIDSGILQRAIDAIAASGLTEVGPSYLQRKLGLNHKQVGALLGHLAQQGVVGPLETIGATVGARVLRLAQPADSSLTATSDTRATRPSSNETRRADDQTTCAAVADSSPAKCEPLPAHADGKAELSIDGIRLEEQAQLRSKLSNARVAEFVAALESGDEFPPVLVVRDPEGTLRLADGFHRIAAHRKLGRTVVVATVVSGTARDVLLHALRANVSHGQPLSRKERRGAALRLLRDPEWRTWSNQELGRRCNLTGMTIGRLRNELGASGSSNNVRARCRKYRTKDGRTHKVDTSNIGRKGRLATGVGIAAAADGSVTVTGSGSEAQAGSGGIRPDLVRELMDLLDRAIERPELLGGTRGKTGRANTNLLLQKLQRVAELMQPTRADPTGKRVTAVAA